MRYKISLIFFPIRKKCIELSSFANDAINEKYKLIKNIEDNLSHFSNNMEGFTIERDGTFSFYKYYSIIDSSKVLNLYLESVAFLQNFLDFYNLSISYRKELNFIFSGENIDEFLTSKPELFESFHKETNKTYSKLHKYQFNNYIMTSLTPSNVLI